MKQHRLVFSAPGRITIELRDAPKPAADEVLVKTRYSAISPGTEMLIYRDQWPQGVPLDNTIDALAGNFAYPLSYGYCVVGRVIDVGVAVTGDWLGRRVFAFQPHQDLFCAKPETLHPIAADIDDQTALFLPSMETAVNLLLDGNPLIGEKVIVIGTGIIGLLTTTLLSRFPLRSLAGLDSYPLRRAAALRLGADVCLDPAEFTSFTQLGGVVGQGGEADLVYELSGNPAGLDMALALTRFSGRVVVGSWYGAKKLPLDLGSFFHRGRVTFISSQVSSIAPHLTGRWSSGRRLELAWEMLRRIRPSSCISHRFALTDAAQAYALIDRSPEETILVIFDHQMDSEQKV